jgi:HEAT repeat protein
LESEELTALLVALASDKDELVRSEAAFAIGVVAVGPELDARLEDALRALADDPYTDARFNAAVALARIGSPLAPTAVAEMLDPEAIMSSLVGEKAIAVDETKQQLRSRQAYKRNTILTSALSAVGLMLEHKTPAAALGVVEQAIEKFIAAAPAIQDPSPVPDEIVDAAQRALEQVQAARK